MNIPVLVIIINVVCYFGINAQPLQRGLRGLQTIDAPIFNVTVSFGGVDPLFQGLTIPPNAAVTGMWSGLNDWPIVSIHTSVLPDGRIVTYGAPPGGDVQDGRVFVFWDPALGLGGSSISLTSNAEFVDSFCSSATLQTDGNFLISGGA
jgi:hypothetical protein